VLTATQGEAIMHHTFERYDEFRGADRRAAWPA
jgi:predicted membrane GTPase involved in stress response